MVAVTANRMNAAQEIRLGTLAVKPRCRLRRRRRRRPDRPAAQSQARERHVRAPRQPPDLGAGAGITGGRARHPQPDHRRVGSGTAGVRDRNLARCRTGGSARPGWLRGDFREASQQIGVTETNDFVFGKLRKALRKRLFDGITANRVTGAVSLTSPDLPLHLDNIPANEKIIAKLEAPLAVQGRTPRSGFFPLSKFSAVPLIMQAARAAVAESGNDDVKKRFMIVSNCHPPTMSRQRSGCGEHHRCQRRVVRQLQTGRGEALPTQPHLVRPGPRVPRRNTQSLAEEAVPIPDANRRATA